MKDTMKWFVSEESGQGMVEYGLIVALISIVTIAALTALGKALENTFERASSALKTVR